MSAPAGPLPPEVGDYLEMLAAERGAGANTIELSNPGAYAPDFNEIIVG